MSKKVVRAGKVLIENGTNAAANILDIAGGPAGGAGGTVLVTAAASNAGTIRIAGGAASTGQPQAGGQGGLLDVLGVLTNTGAILVGAGASGGTPSRATEARPARAASSSSPAPWRSQQQDRSRYKATRGSASARMAPSSPIRACSTMAG